jgi:hypothetical protein
VHLGDEFPFSFSRRTLASMQLSSFLGVAALTTLASAAPVADNLRDLTYGDRTAYASAWNAGHAPPQQSYYPAPGGQGGYPPPPPPPSGGNNQPSPGNNNPGSPPPDNSQGIPAPPKQASDKPFALDNGFPTVANPSDALTKINLAARGTLSNAPPPANPPSAQTLTSLKLIAFNELFETFYFTELLKNVTEGVKGYGFQDQALKKKVIDTLVAVQAQEQLHALNANNALNRFNAGPIKACQYDAPVDNFIDAIKVASTFTDVVLGTLADVSVVSDLQSERLMEC